MTHMTGELSGDQLSRLLAAALGETDTPDDATRIDGTCEQAEALAAALACPLPGRADQVISDVLLGAAPDRDDLQAVKDLGRRMAESPSELDRPAGTVLYYAAIARVLSETGERITRHDPQTLALNLADLVGREWIPPDIRTVLTSGQQACAQGAAGPARTNRTDE